MDHESLRTASNYLNNLLLARGLLRNSTAIDFVKPSRDSRASIINLVHDLILREDRDRENRENLSGIVATLRAAETKSAHEIERLKAREEECARGVVQARTAERAAREEVRRLERVVKGLQEQATRLKGALAQVRAQCVNDVRKRDGEVARLKTFLQGQQRGSKGGMVAASITVVGGARRQQQQQQQQSVDARPHGLEDPEYSLKQETTEFLTQLSQSLSDENDGLIGLIQGALTTMRELLGLPAMVKQPDSAIGSVGSNEDGKAENNMLHSLPTSYEALAAGLDSTMAHLKTVLTNPNFVSMEEVEVREEEIVRLREGWERMEQRWKDVLIMMESWRRKMDTGHTINLEDLRKGMGLVSPEHLRVGVRNEEPEMSFVNGDVSEIRLPGSEVDQSSFIVEPAARSSTGKSSPKRKRDVMEPPEFFDLRPSSRKSAPEPLQQGFESDGPEASDDDNHEDSQPRLTVSDKLENARVEAEQATLAQTLHTQANGTQKTQGATALGPDGAADSERDDTLGKMVPMSPMAKKTKIRGRPKRRKSTLSPEELEALIGAAGED